MKEGWTDEIIGQRYRLVRELGVGGIGSVYLAEDEMLSRLVAVKTVRKEMLDNQEVLQRVDREWRLHATLGIHPNIVALFDKLIWDGRLFVIMEYVPGGTLADLMEERRQSGRTMSLEDALSICYQVLDALQHIHRHNILHRDVKPSNIILQKREGGGFVAKLMDFGIATLENEEDHLTKLTLLSAGGPGTPAYMAPERIDSETYGEQGPATDLYSVGVILYELLCDVTPFRGTLTEIFTGHLTRPPDMERLAAKVPKDVTAAILCALEKKQTRRFQAATEFSATLRRALAENTGAGSQPFGSVIENDRTMLVTDTKAAIAAIRANETLLSTKTGLTHRPRANHARMAFIALALALVAAVAAGGWWLLRPADKQQNSLAGPAAEAPPSPPEVKPDASSPQPPPVALPESPRNDKPPVVATLPPKPEAPAITDPPEGSASPPSRSPSAQDLLRDLRDQPSQEPPKRISSTPSPPPKRPEPPPKKKKQRPQVTKGSSSGFEVISRESRRID